MISRRITAASRTPGLGSRNSPVSSISARQRRALAWMVRSSHEGSAMARSGSSREKQVAATKPTDTMEP